MVAFVGIAVLAFCSTDVDDLFVLIALFADRSFRRRDIVVGQFSGMAVLYAVSVVCALSALVIPKAWIGLLGFAPIVIGVSKLYSLRQARGGDTVRPPSASGGVLAVAAVTLANGGDNLGAWIPLFATHSAFEIALAGLVFTVMTAGWCLMANWLLKHPSLQTPVRRYGHRVVPFVLMGLGLVILMESGSAGLLRH
jgi:cadmium resistance protein CadD (predicted permease)